MDYKSLKQKIQKMFEKNGVDATSDIDWIMVEVTGKSRSQLPFLSQINKTDEQKILRLAKLRSKHIPLDYILGKSEFFGYKFIVNENCLIPRLDTEVLVEKLIEKIKAVDGEVSVLDIGTGSGAIAIAVSKETGAVVTAVDVSQKALDIAIKNNELNNAEVEFIQSNLFENLSGRKFDFIVSNPPYIKSSVIEELDEEVWLHEPILALDGGEDGLEFYKNIIKDAKNHLKDGGMIFFEIGYDQADDVSKLLKNDYTNIQVVKDYGGNNRVVFATKGNWLWLKD